MIWSGCQGCQAAWRSVGNLALTPRRNRGTPGGPAAARVSRLGHYTASVRPGHGRGECSQASHCLSIPGQNPPDGNFNGPLSKDDSDSDIILCFSKNLLGRLAAGAAPGPGAGLTLRPAASLARKSMEVPEASRPNRLDSDQVFRPSHCPAPRIVPKFSS